MEGRFSGLGVELYVKAWEKNPSLDPAADNKKKVTEDVVMQKKTKERADYVSDSISRSYSYIDFPRFERMNIEGYL